MARIPEEELERLKREISIQALAEALGVALQLLQARQGGAGLQAALQQGELAAASLQQVVLGADQALLQVVQALGIPCLEDANTRRKIRTQCAPHQV